MAFFEVELTNKPALAPYSCESLVSFNQDGAKIHLLDTMQNKERAIQKATRKIASTGVNDIKFTGKWSQLQQILFVQSFCGPNFQGQFDWADDSQKVELENFLDALLFTRKIVNQTPEEMSPESLANQAQDYISDIAGKDVSFRRWTGDELVEANWMGIYEVGRGSERPPVLLEIDYNPNQSDSTDVALVGKGITFDSGGYSIKSSEGMLDMKCDMGGAATVTAALGLAIMQGLSKRVKVYLCCAENLISGHAYKLGDIIQYKNGVTAEIVNTDAEGRLVLADGLMAASETQAKLIIDAATLTGAAIAALGKEYNAVFSMHDDACGQYLNTANELKEPHWRLPLEPWHSEQCPSPFADTANSRPQRGGGAGGASNAAGFLARFVDTVNCEWLHIDLAAAYNRNASDMMPAGATAIGIRSISQTLLNRN